MVRRQTQNGGAVAGSGRELRLDPLSLPARFAATDAAADGRMRVVELHRERIVMRRSVRGMRMAVNLPVTVYRGIALRIETDEPASSLTVSLEHADPGLTVTLFSGEDDDDIVAEWQLWARVLGLPLLIADAGGELRAPFPQLGAVRVREVKPRRRRSNAIGKRRPRIQFRRRATELAPDAAVHHGEREIVARN